MRGTLVALAVAALAFGVLVAGPAAAASSRYRCTGDLSNIPASVGVLQGTYNGDVQVSGACAVLAGPTVINGNLTVLPGSTLLAAFGETNFQPGSPSSTLTVHGNVKVGAGATLIMGCNTTSFTFLDDPASNDQSITPSLSSPDSVSGNVTSTQPLGVIVHSTGIGGNVTENGGGGGVSCAPPAGTIFSVIGFPAYSDYEDSTVGGNLGVRGLASCWLGMARVDVGGNMLVLQDHLADPDAVEIIGNSIDGNLVCQQNSMVWDSIDISPTGDLYPRLPAPNTVNGHRVGQCVLASPATEGGPPGPGPF